MNSNSLSLIHDAPFSDVHAVLRSSRIPWTVITLHGPSQVSARQIIISEQVSLTHSHHNWTAQIACTDPAAVAVAAAPARREMVKETEV